MTVLTETGKDIWKFQSWGIFHKTPPEFGSTCIGEMSKIKFYSDL